MNKVLFVFLSVCLSVAATGDNGSTQGFVDISTAQLDGILIKKSALIVDVRTPREYRRGHIPGAISLPHAEILSGQVDWSRYQERNLILYCHTGVRVGKVERFLETKNTASAEGVIYHLKGGFRAWSARRNPVESEQF